MIRSWMNVYEDLQMLEVKKRFMFVYKSYVGKYIRYILDR